MYHQVQPTFSLKYFQLKKTKVPKNVFSKFFLSWEDALWWLLKFHHTQSNSKILLPDFYCCDVVNNMISHNLQPIFYPLNSNLKVDTKDFYKKITLHKPSIIVIFHPVGITSNLTSNSDWITAIGYSPIIIEDSVHRVINPHNIHFFAPNHYIIDSLRKTQPLLGSWLYSSHAVRDFTTIDYVITFNYRLQVTILWFAMQLAFGLGNISLGEKLMLKGYDLIGDSYNASPGSILFKVLSRHISHSRINIIKKHQVHLYLNKLTKMTGTNSFIIPPFSQHDYANLRGFPLIISLKHASSFIHFVRNKQLLLRFELEGSQWSKRQKIVYLPLGPHLTNKSQADIIRTLGEWAGR